ncbi:XRE family transcriptional regulator [Pseudoflavonifractor sp. 60]|nr:XRE family transcriptional regulator [Pseudoflavonifractor sp. 60]
MSNQIFPKRLQNLRKQKQLSAHALSELCGMGKNRILLYEKGEQEPTISKLEAIADFFDVSTDYLLGRDHK